jgi:DNA-binding ferritin-like protein
MTKATIDADTILKRATPIAHQQSHDKKHHWQIAGPTFYQLHLLFDKHYEEQNALVDSIAERIQLLGGVSLAMAPDVAETTLIPRPPKGREEAPTQVSRLLHAHEIVLKEARTMASPPKAATTAPMTRS